MVNSDHRDTTAQLAENKEDSANVRGAQNGLECQNTSQQSNNITHPQHTEQKIPPQIQQKINRFGHFAEVNLAQPSGFQIICEFDASVSEGKHDVRQIEEVCILNQNKDNENNVKSIDTTLNTGKTSIKPLVLHEARLHI